MAIEFLGEKYAQMDDLKKVLNKKLNKYIDQAILDKLYVIMDYGNKGAITEIEFMTIMKPWASFSATDINNDNELDIVELKTLIWLTDGEEPDAGRV